MVLSPESKGMSQEIDPPLSELGQGWNCHMCRRVILIKEE